MRLAHRMRSGEVIEVFQAVPVEEEPMVQRSIPTPLTAP